MRMGRRYKHFTRVCRIPAVTTQCGTLMHCLQVCICWGLMHRNNLILIVLHYWSKLFTQVSHLVNHIIIPSESSDYSRSDTLVPDVCRKAARLLVIPYCIRTLTECHTPGRMLYKTMEFFQSSKLELSILGRYASPRRAWGRGRAHGLQNYGDF